MRRKPVMACLGVLLLLAVGVAGCKTMEEATNIATSLGTAAGVITETQGQSIAKGAKAVARSFEDFTPEQEYYLGRTVGGIILKQYQPYANDKANHYINILGQTLAQASELPETYGGYHFLIQDTDDINALAAPGGLIFITRGLLRCCRNEDAVAAVLAHEIGHVQFKHGLRAIKTARVTEALTTIGIMGAKAFGGEDLANLTQTFEDSISDITSTLINNGYSRELENQADMAAATILKRVGYDPNGLVDMLEVMQQRLKPGRLDFARTHPSPASRIADVLKVIGKSAPVKTPAARQARFMAVLGNI
ncbi:MAG: M48 family metallopeptidase [Proteobacteria bacterium]|nr:M48 family metallopeptidase [Pseudomonadota bacterium]